MKNKKYLLNLLIGGTSLFLLLILMKGEWKNGLYFQKELDISVGGPFEGSNSSSRFALTRAIVTEKTFYLNKDLAKFASPDVVKVKNGYFSVFTPGVSLIGVPFYLIGKGLGLPQLLTYSSNILLALLNFYLIGHILQKMGLNKIIGYISGFIFLFATNALSYSLTFTQHHASTAIILLSLLISMNKRSAMNNIIFGMLFGLGIFMDIPNAFLLLPVLIFILIKNIPIKKDGNRVTIGIKLSIFGLALGLLPFLGLFAYYNLHTSGSITKIGQSISRTSDFSYNNAPGVPLLEAASHKNDTDAHTSLPFKTRYELNDLYILLLSNERGWLFYSPILLFGIYGLYLAYKSINKQISILLISIILVNVVMYSMFSDPWGGWSFGPRYLIPAAALLSIAAGVTINSYRRSPFFYVIFISLLLYSVIVNTAGALTTTAVPPKIESVNLPINIPYTYNYNFQLLNKGHIHTLFYNIFLFKIISPLQFLYIYVFLVLVVFIVLILNIINENKNR